MARARGFSAELTRMVLLGKRKCLRGQSHQIAVALGIKASARANEHQGLRPFESDSEGEHTPRKQKTDHLSNDRHRR